ncbi:ATP-binding protein [Niveispirillum irakense]|uniref:ATP-binding protein n=1 Tax=Niveispirillum irakense TaxID=34011 RepID=UPI00041E4094|nr:ATP-binding protein [Niveispirillum irakense]
MDYRLASGSLEKGDLARASASFGLPLADKAPQAVQVVLVTESAAGELVNALRSRCAAIIEYTEGALPAAALRDALAAGHLLVSLTTRMAWTLDTAAQFCEGLMARGMMPEGLRHDVELSLHEAIINAVLHGNLAMGGSLVDDPRQFDAFCQRLSAKLAEPERALKRIDLSAWIAEAHLHVRIADEGDGYDSDLVRQPATPDAKSGRGLEIMRVMSHGLTVSDGGRTATLRFAI